MGKIAKTTRMSTVEGLKCGTSKKWMLFLKDGPYWNYIASHIARKNYFAENDGLIDVAVNMTAAKVSRALSAGGFVYKAAGQGYFRAFLKKVAERVALDVLRQEKRQTSSIATGREEREILDDTEKPEKGARRRHISLDVFAEGVEKDWKGSFDPVAMQEYLAVCSDREIAYLKQVREHVFRLALISVLSDEKVAVRRRAVLDLLYVQHLKPAEIYRMEEYAGLKRPAFDQMVFQAKRELEAPVLAFWREVSPDGFRDAEQKLKDLWRQLSQSARTWKLARKLKLSE